MEPEEFNSEDPVAGVASLPDNIREVAGYLVIKSGNGIHIQHQYQSSHIWIDGRDVKEILSAANELLEEN
jgi:hypothetical protein